jgi:hypothetical protein
MSSQTQAAFSASAFAADLADLAHRHGRPILGQCRWPIEIVSRKRELDLTECFENGVLLPVPLLLVLLLALGQLFSIRSRMKRGEVNWVNRGQAGESVYGYKSVCLPLNLRLQG